MNLKSSFLAFALLAIVSIANGAADRKVDPTWNPDCSSEECQGPVNDSYNNLFYVKLTGSNDIIHILYSTIESFTIMLFRTNLNVNLNVNWTNLLSHNASLMRDSISFSEKPLESAGYDIPTIYEFVDLDGNADMTKANETYLHLTSNLLWKKFDNTTNTFEGSFRNTNGSFKFVINYPGKDKRDDSLPHLLLNPESTSIDFKVDSIEPKSNSSKFGVGIVYLSDLAVVDVFSKRTIDDEYTPGTFKLWNAQVQTADNKVSNFLQWKPIFYYYEPKTLENSTITKQYDLKQSVSHANGIGLAFFDENKLFSAMNVSFGLEGNAKDGYYYTQTNFSSWSFSVGMGPAPNEKMSFVVTVVIIVGFGLPALVILVGLVVMVVKKIRGSNRSQFNRLD